MLLSLPISCCYVSYLCLILDIASNYFTVAFFHCKSCAFRDFFCGLAHHVGKRWPSFIARVVLSVRRSRTISKHNGFRCFLWVGSSCWEGSFIARAVLSVGRSRAIAKHTGFRDFLWVGSSCWEEVTFFHCKSCAFSRSKPRYCQTHWFQMFFVELQSIGPLIQQLHQHCLIFHELSSSTSQIYFCNVAISRRQNWKKKRIPQMIDF